MDERHQIVVGSVTMTSANTQYSVDIPVDACELSMTLTDDTKTWRWSPTEGVVAAAGYPMVAGDGLAFDKKLRRTTLYFASATAAQTMNYSYLLPDRTA